MSLTRSLVAATVAGVLIVPASAGTVAVAASTPTPAASPPSLPRAEAAPQIVRGKASPAPQFSIAVLERDAARLGGSGAVDVVLTRRGTMDKAVSDTRVRVSAPAGTSITRASGKGWTCSKPKSDGRIVNCTQGGSIAARVSPSPIRVLLDINLKAERRAPVTRIQALATWKGDPAAESSPWPKPWLVRDAGPLSVYPALDASISSPAGRSLAILTRGASTSRQVVLAGHLVGGEGGQVTAEWFVKSGPKPQFLTPRVVQGAQAEINQTLQYPDNLEGASTSVIGLRVSSDGRTVTRTITLDLNARKQLGEVDGRNQRFPQLAAASRIPVPFEDFVDADDNHIVILPRQQPLPPGSQITLSVQPRTGGQIESLAWYLVGDDDSTTFVTDSPTATFTVPSEPGDSQVVQVAAVMVGGETHEEGYILYALEDEAAVLSGREDTTEDDTSANVAIYCSLVTNVLDQRKAGTNEPLTIDPPGGVKLTFTPSQADISKSLKEGECATDGTMRIAGGTLEHPSAWTFKDVQASVDPAGLTITQMGWVPTGSVLLRIFKLAGGSGALVTWKGTLVSELTDGSWNLLGGSVDLQPFANRFGQTVYGPEFLPLPGGWSIPPGSTKLLFVNKDDSAPADNTLRMSQEVKGSKDGKGTFTADAVYGSLDNVVVALTNIVLGDNGEGDSLVANGQGRFSLNAETAQRKVTIGIECYRDKKLSPDCELVDRLMLKSFTVTLGESITLNAQASFRYADDQVFAFAVAGKYTDSKTWSLTGTTSDPWNLGGGLTLKSLKALIERKPRGEKEPDKTDLFINVEGTLEGITFGSAVEVTSLTTRVTNQCAKDETRCAPTEMRLQVDADIKALLPGSSTPTPFNVRAFANLSKLEFTFIGTARDIAIGPQGMQVTKARFILTNAVSMNTCRAKGSPAPPDGEYTAAIGGEVVLLGKTFAVNAQFNKDGYCLWGNSGALDLKAEGLRAKSGTLAYTNFKSGAVLVTDDTPVAGTISAASTSTIEVAPDRIQLSGDFELPVKVREFLGADGLVTYEATVGTNLKSADFRLRLEMKDDVVLYQQTQASPGTSIRSQVTMSSVALKVAYDIDATQAELKLTAAGKVIVPRQDDPTRASITPVAVGGSFTLKGGSISLTIDAGVDISKGAVKDAFGQPGLEIRELTVAIGISLPVPSLKAAFNGDVTLPASWGSSAGIKPDTPIKLGMVLDASTPCLVIGIGQEDRDKRKLALDLANLGVVTADFFKLVLAPVGCSLPSVGGKEDKIGKGYAFVFDGRIMGSPVNLSLEVGLGDGLKIKAIVDLPKPIDLYAVQFSNSDRTRGPKLAFDIDTKAGKYDIDIDAHLEIGSVKYYAGFMVNIKGSLRTSSKDYIEADLTGYAEGALGPISVKIPQKRDNGRPGLDVKLKIAKAGAAKGSDRNNFVQAGAELRVGVVGLQLMLSADLNYADGQLVELKAVVDANINIIVASLRARVQFDLCQGTLSPMQQDAAKGSKCTRFANLTGASPSIRVGLTGRYRILWWSKDYLWQAYDSVGKEGSPPAPNDAKPLDLTTEIPEGAGTPGISSEYVVKNHDALARPQEPRFSTQYVKVLRGEARGDVPACDSARVGAKGWQPSKDDTNPMVQPQDVYPMGPDERCGLAVRISNGRTFLADDFVECRATRCYLAGRSAGLYTLVPRSGRPSLTEARAQLFTGLTTPPGFMPSGGILEKEGLSPAVIDGWDGKSELRAEEFSLKLVNERGQNVWSFGTKTTATAISSHFELRGGALSARLIQFTQPVRGVYSLSKEILVTTTKAADGVSVKPMLVVSDGQFTVYDGSIGSGTILWGVKKDGSCFYNKDRVGKLDANFCKK